MDNHDRDILAETVRRTRRSIQRQRHALDHETLGWLVTFGQDWEAMQRDTTAWTKVQGFRIRNHLINAYLRKALAWRHTPFARVLLIETTEQETHHA